MPGNEFDAIDVQIDVAILFFSTSRCTPTSRISRARPFNLERAMTILAFDVTHIGQLPADPRTSADS